MAARMHRLHIPSVSGEWEWIEPQRGGARHGPPPPQVDKRAASYRTTNVNGKTQSVGGISTGACWPSNQPPERSFIFRVELW